MAITLNNKFADEKLKKGLQQYSVKFGAVVLMYASTKAQYLDTKLKVDRKWTDRTGMAKSQLKARVSRPSNSIIRITCSHGVDYGIYLELCNSKKYAVIAPTIQTESPKIIAGLNNITSKIKLNL